MTSQGDHSEASVAAFCCSQIKEPPVHRDPDPTTSKDSRQRPPYFARSEAEMAVHFAAKTACRKMG